MLQLAAYIQNLDPVAIHVFDLFAIRWYGLSYLAGFLLGFFWLRSLARRGVTTLPPWQVSELAFTLAIGTIVGGRLGYAIFYQQSLLWTFTGSLPFWDLLALNRGGMASHGGMIGLILAALWFQYRSKTRGLSSEDGQHRLRITHQPLHLLDIIATAGPAGVFCGRLANFVNGELLGRPAPASLPWGVKFPQELRDPEVWPIERLVELMQAAPPDDPSINAHQYIQWVIEQVQAGNAHVVNAVGPMLRTLHPSQLYAALSEGVFVMAVLLIVWLRPRKPGVVGAWFLLAYGCARIFNEFFRQPDAHIANREFAAIGITRGQWLSAVMLLAGVVLMIICTHRTSEKFGGWLKPANPLTHPGRDRDNSGNGNGNDSTSSSNAESTSPPETP